ncbi:MAG: cation diffusion facilitator family transporter [Alphaproteobacteria bacterium]|nr:cation diffusion facilitator family transporter [Alphaproteobacteria bacterium]
MDNHSHQHLGNVEKQRVALISMLASACIALIKMAAAVVTGSLGILSEAIHALIDLGATIVTVLAVRWSSRPADDNHQFGHEKIESVAALLETVLLFGTALFIAYKAVMRLITPHEPLTIEWWAYGIMLVSIAIDLNRSRALRKAAKQTQSDALKADALHFESDMWGSAAVLLGLLGVSLGYQWADSLAALIVSGYIAYIAWELGSGTLNTLLDAAPDGVSSFINDIVEKQDGALSLNQLRVRPAGSRLFVNMDVNVPRLLGSEAVETLKRKLVQSIHAKHPNADIAISTNPVALDNETAFEKIGLIANQRGLSIHHITVQQIQGRMAASFDLEVEGSTNLAEAHRVATELEDAIRNGLGGDVEVESHIEPQPARLMLGELATPALTKKVEAALKALARTEKTLSDLHNIRVREMGNGLYVHYHCRFAPEARIDAVHSSVDRIENALTDKIKTIIRVVAHAEPLGEARHKL